MKPPEQDTHCFLLWLKIHTVLTTEMLQVELCLCVCVGGGGGGGGGAGGST